jgi:lambda family phage portal protein
VTVSGARSIQGIDIAADGHRLGYWLMRDHPGDGVFASRTGSARVDAGQIIHLMRSYAARPGQVRAVSDLAPVLMRMHALDDYEDAMLEMAKIEAALTAFVKSDAAPGTGPLASTEPTAGGEEREVFFAPGQVNFLNPGESVDFAIPSGVGQFEPLALHFLMSIAIGAGVTYDQLTGDLRQANFSSLRAGKIEFRRVMQQDQYLMLVPQLCTPLWRWFIDAAIVAGKLPERAGGYPVRWSPPPFEMIDPTREIPARIDAIRAGLATPQSEIAADGEDWRETIASYREWNDALDQAGVMLTSDPRRFADTGAAQNAAQNAAIEIGARQSGTPVPRRTAPQPEETP